MDVDAAAPTPPKEALVRQCLAEALASPSFSRSSRLSRFLRFVVESSLDGAEENLKEYTIGVEVFDRDETFDPRIETIVRVEARRLRNQLSEYYGGPGREDQLRIEIPKGGYRPVFRPRSPVQPAGPSQALDPKTIVVLPFADMTPGGDQSYWGDGLAEEITHALAQVEGLQVISRTSAFAFRDQNLEVREIGQKLGAGTALEGSIRTSQQQIRVTAQLIDAASGRHLWSERFDRNLDDAFKVQDDVTQAVLERLRETLAGNPAQHPKRRRPVNRSAFDLYLKGRHSLYRYTREGVASAIDCFESATAQDSNYAQPWAGLAEAYTISAIVGWAPPREVMPRAKKAALRAIEIDDRAAEAHASLAMVLFRYDYEWENAEKAYERAMELSPGSGTIRIWYASFLVFRQRPEQAIFEARRASELDPLSVEAQRVVADTLYFCRRYDETVEQCQLILSHHPNYYFAHFYIGMALVGQQRPCEAVEALATAKRLAGETPMTRSMLAWASAKAGNATLARELLEALEEERKRSYFPSFLIALVYNGLGDVDPAFEWLERGLADRDALFPVLEVDQTWDPLRSDVRFTSILERMGLG